ncbi:MAG: 4Fe-4S dicluster domain-containing protein [Anaerolineae bacterium]
MDAATIHGTQYARSLACIRCGACLNTCPVYQNVGGHAYGWVYPVLSARSSPRC